MPPADLHDGPLPHLQETAYGPHCHPSMWEIINVRVTFVSTVFARSPMSFTSVNHDSFIENYTEIHVLIIYMHYIMTLQSLLTKNGLIQLYW